MNQLALDRAGKYVYVTDNVDGEVDSIATADGTQNIVVLSANGPMGIVVDATHVYWTEAGTCSGSDSSATCTGGEVRRATAPSGGSASTLVGKITSTGALGGLCQGHRRLDRGLLHGLLGGDEHPLREEARREALS